MGTEYETWAREHIVKLVEWAKHHDDCIDAVKAAIGKMQGSVDEKHAENTKRLRSLEDSRLQVKTLLWLVGVIWPIIVAAIEFLHFHNK